MADTASKPIARDRLMEALCTIPVWPNVIPLTRLREQAGYANAMDLLNDVKMAGSMYEIEFKVANTAGYRNSVAKHANRVGYVVAVMPGWAWKLREICEKYIDARGDKF